MSQATYLAYVLFDQLIISQLFEQKSAELTCFSQLIKSMNHSISACALLLALLMIYTHQQCSEGTYYNQTLKSCQQCDITCLQCFSSISCTTCYDQMYLQTNNAVTKCVLCSKVQLGCATCDTATTCIQCSNSYYLTTANTCVSCNNITPGCLLCDGNGTVCKSCKSPYILTNGVFCRTANGTSPPAANNNATTSMKFNTTTNSNIIVNNNTFNQSIANKTDPLGSNTIATNTSSNNSSNVSVSKNNNSTNNSSLSNKNVSKPLNNSNNSSTLSNNSTNNSNLSTLQTNLQATNSGSIAIAAPATIKCEFGHLNFLGNCIRLIYNCLAYTFDGLCLVCQNGCALSVDGSSCLAILLPSINSPLVNSTTNSSINSTSNINSMNGGAITISTNNSVQCTSRQYYKNGICNDVGSACLAFTTDGVCTQCDPSFQMYNGLCIQAQTSNLQAVTTPTNSTASSNTTTVSASSTQTVNVPQNVSTNDTNNCLSPCLTCQAGKNTYCLTCVSAYAMVDLLPGRCFKI